MVDQIGIPTWYKFSVDYVFCETASFNYVVINNGHADRLSLDSAMESTGSRSPARPSRPCRARASRARACWARPPARSSATGYDLFEKVKSGAYNEVTQTYPGTDSPAGCGANSVYQALWSAVRA